MQKAFLKRRTNEKSTSFVRFIGTASISYAKVIYSIGILSVDFSPGTIFSSVKKSEIVSNVNTFLIVNLIIIIIFTLAVFQSRINNLIYYEVSI